MNNAQKILYKNADNLVKFDGLKNVDTGIYVNDATLTGVLTLEDSTTSIATLSFTLQTDSTVGNYRATLPAATTNGLTEDTAQAWAKFQLCEHIRRTVRRAEIYAYCSFHFSSSNQKSLCFPRSSSNLTIIHSL